MVHRNMSKTFIQDRKYHPKKLNLTENQCISCRYCTGFGQTHRLGIIGAVIWEYLSIFLIRKDQKWLHILRICLKSSLCSFWTDLGLKGKSVRSAGTPRWRASQTLPDLKLFSLSFWASLQLLNVTFNPETLRRVTWVWSFVQTMICLLCCFFWGGISLNGFYLNQFLLWFVPTPSAGFCRLSFLNQITDRSNAHREDSPFQNNVFNNISVNQFLQR